MNYRTQPALILDYDGTIRRSKSGRFIQSPEDIELLPGVEARIWEYRKNDFLVAGLSNQGGVAHGFKTLEQVAAEFKATHELFDVCPIEFLSFCPFMEDGTVETYSFRSLLRKPYYGGLVHIEQEARMVGRIIDWDRSLLVGDREEDRQCAEAAGIRFEWAKEFFQFED